MCPPLLSLPSKIQLSEITAGELIVLWCFSFHTKFDCHFPIKTKPVGWVVWALAVAHRLLAPVSFFYSIFIKSGFESLTAVLVMRPEEESVPPSNSPAPFEKGVLYS